MPLSTVYRIVNEVQFFVDTQAIQLPNFLDLESQCKFYKKIINEKLNKQYICRIILEIGNARGKRILIINESINGGIVFYIFIIGQSIKIIKVIFILFLFINILPLYFLRVLRASQNNGPSSVYEDISINLCEKGYNFLSLGG